MDLHLRGALAICLFALPVLGAAADGIGKQGRGEARPTVTGGTELFEERVYPLLQEHCFKCHSHSGDKIKGGLVVDSLQGLLTGGDSGAAIVPGAPDKSLLVKAIRYTDEDLQMPPKGKRLSAEQVAFIEQWIKDGAVWPGQTGKPSKARGKITDEDRKWWAFQRVQKVPVPKVKDGAWPRNELDYFVLARLEAAGIKPAPQSEPGPLARRVYLNIHGLPPTAQQMDAFLNSASGSTYDSLIETLLASPRYGERWARHWLDLVRYADSDGYRIDDLRPMAWRYRDYVIKSLNADKPYDVFIREQLAGDEMSPRTPERLIATGYLRHWIYEYNNRDAAGQWTTILNDITDTTADVFMGVGLQCARCHDHKFDPILQKDYYRLQAFFAPILPREDIDVATAAERAQYQEKLSAWSNATAEVTAEIERLLDPHRKKAAHEAIIKFPKEIQALLLKPAAERKPWEHQVAELAYRQVTYEYDRLHTKIKGDDRETLLTLQKKLGTFDQLKPAPLPRGIIVTDVGPEAPPVTMPKRPNEPIEPGYLSVLNENPATISPAGTNTTGRRTELARWLTDNSNPLTARVVVNRVWQYHFGRGLVGTSSDFGKLGDKPTHPELLDWLANWFVENGWSLKKLHRLILTSSTYRQGSRPAEATATLARQIDPENRLLWRAPVRRLDAEQIRDSLLMASGELDLTEGGPAVDAFKPRRSIYTKVLRNTRDPLLDVFDAPQHFNSTSQRDATTTPVQSLFLINSQYMLQRARHLSERLQGGRSSNPSDRELVRAAYRVIFNREPTAEEIVKGTKFLADQPARIDPQRIASAAAEFVSDKIPYRDGKAAVMSVKLGQDRLMVPNTRDFPTNSFTIEAFIVLRSLYDSGAVRTIASHWSGKPSDPGWSLGVTSTKSARRPQTLVLQLTGLDAAGKTTYEAVFSDLHLNLNKPYFVAASIDVEDPSENGITFYAKDLSNDDEPIQVAHMAHRVTAGVRSAAPFAIGGRAAVADHFFDGLVDDVRLSYGALRQEQLLLTSEGVTEQTCGYWQFEPKPDVFRDSSPRQRHISPHGGGGITLNPKEAARADFCHVLLNANEFLYVE